MRTNSEKIDLKNLTFGEYLEFHAPCLERYSRPVRLWDAVKRDSLEGAAIWKCNLKTMSRVRFSYQEPGMAPGSICAHGFVGDAWAGIPGAYYSDGDYVSSGLCLGWVASLPGVVYLNNAIASWTGQPYTPTVGTSEGYMCGFLLAIDAGWGGDVDQMTNALAVYGVAPNLDYRLAFYLAATRGHLPFMRALLNEFGNEVSLNTFKACESFETANDSDKEAVANTLSLGVPFPGWCRPALVHWSKSDPRFTVYLL